MLAPLLETEPDILRAPHDPAMAWELLHADSDGRLWEAVGDGYYLGVRLLRLAIEAKRVTLLDAEVLLATTSEPDLPRVSRWMQENAQGLRAAALGLEVMEGGSLSHQPTIRSSTKTGKGKIHPSTTPKLDHGERMRLAAEIGCEARALPDAALLSLAEHVRALRTQS
jgi:hypothetical protein